MNVEQKSLELAKLMGWRVYEGDNGLHFTHEMGCLSPYDDRPRSDGRAQFAAILLGSPEVLIGIKKGDFGMTLKYREDSGWMSIALDQESILDEILRMNGINPDD